MHEDAVAVGIVIRELAGLVERGRLAVFVPPPLELEPELVREEVFGTRAGSVHGEGYRAVILHPEIRAVQRQRLPGEGYPALPGVAQLAMEGRHDVEVLRLADEDLALSLELAAGGVDRHHPLEQRHVDVADELAHLRRPSDLGRVVVAMALAPGPADPDHVLEGVPDAELVPVPVDEVRA